MPYDYSLGAVVVTRSTTTIYVPFDTEVLSPPTEDFALLVDYDLSTVHAYGLSGLASASFATLPLPIAYTADMTAITALDVARAPLLANNFLAVFTLERDEDGDMIFSDTTGAMYGIGQTFLQAVHDWHDSAQQLEAKLHAHGGVLHQQVAEQLQLFERVLSERPAIGQS
jgi:hypothetical protein